jgi:YVTN family beta-propeller protein
MPLKPPRHLFQSLRLQIVENRVMNRTPPARFACFATLTALLSALAVFPPLAAGQAAPSASAAAPRPVQTVAGMPEVRDATNLYSEVGAGKFSAAVAAALPRVYVPNRAENSVSVIDPATLKVIGKFKVGVNPQHIVPAWNLKMLWVANNAEGRTDGSLTPIDPATGKAGASIPVDDPYNVYFTPDGTLAIIVAEAYKRLDFRDPQSMALRYSIQTPDCDGINHADFSIDGRMAVFTCEFNGAVTKIDLVNKRVLATLTVSKYFDRPEFSAANASAVASGKPYARAKPPSAKASQSIAELCLTKGMPQDVRSSPDGKTFFVADMMADGVHVVDLETFRQIGFIATGVGAHGLYPSRDGKQLYVANRGTNLIRGKPGGKGSVSVIDFATRAVSTTWPVPGGGSPDMGNVSADGNYLWLSGRFDDVVYRFDTRSGAVDKVKVGREPHGLTVWPQPGRYSLGHTGNLR